MATDYPRALYHPFHVSECLLRSAAESSERGHNSDASDVSAFNIRLSRLERALHDPLMNRFVVALRGIFAVPMNICHVHLGLHVPHLRLKDGLKKVQDLLDSKKTAAATKLLAEVKQECVSTEWPFVGKQIGKYNRFVF
jgi:hypothetical protein